MNSSKDIRLSPSRINSVNDCSWQYYSSYVLKLPRTGNDGSKRGTICHSLLECLVKPNHRHYVDKLIDNGDIFSFPAIERYLKLLAKREVLPLEQVVVNKDKTGLMTHKEEINNMILVALKSDFLGQPGDTIITEVKHEIEVNRDGKKFKILGIIDKIFVRKNDKGEITEVEIVDYKTSSKKFEEDDLDSNLQGLVYQFFIKDMYPNVPKVKFGFLFLRFPRAPYMEVPPFPKANVSGFEHYLSYISKYMANFTEAHAKKNFAKNSFETKFLCGLHGNKKYFNRATKTKIEHNEPQFICAVRDPYDYYAVVDEEGNNIRSAMTKEELKATPQEIVAKKRYGGCPAWHAQKKNLKRDWNVLQ